MGDVPASNFSRWLTQNQQQPTPAEPGTQPGPGTTPYTPGRGGRVDQEYYNIGAWSPDDPNAPVGWDSQQFASQFNDPNVMNDLGYTNRLPGSHIAPEVQLQSERRVAERNDALMRQALGRGEQLYGESRGALTSGLNSMNAYRPGGAAALMSPYYTGLAQSFQNEAGYQAQIQSQRRTEAPDLMYWRNDQIRKSAEEDAKTAGLIQGLTSLAGQALGAGAMLATGGAAAPAMMGAGAASAGGAAFPGLAAGAVAPVGTGTVLAPPEGIGAGGAMYPGLAQGAAPMAGAGTVLQSGYTAPGPTGPQPQPGPGGPQQGPGGGKGGPGAGAGGGKGGTAGPGGPGMGAVQGGMPGSQITPQMVEAGIHDSVQPSNFNFGKEILRRLDWIQARDQGVPFPTDTSVPEWVNPITRRRMIEDSKRALIFRGQQQPETDNWGIRKIEEPQSPWGFTRGEVEFIGAN